MLPMGEMSYRLAIKANAEYSIEGDGLLVREGVVPGFVTTSPITKMTKHENWSLVYETLYQLSPTTDFKTIMPLVKDPLLFLNEVLLRDDDNELDHRCCLMVKYPM